MSRTRRTARNAAWLLVLATAACEGTAPSAPESATLRSAGAPSAVLVPVIPSPDTALSAQPDTAWMALADTTPQRFGPEDGTRSRDFGDDTFNLNFWVDGRHITHRVRTLIQDSRTVERTGKPDLIFEWAILDDWLYGAALGSDDFIGIIGEDRNNDGMISYPSEVIGFWGRCSLATNDTYSVNDPATGKPRWVHWENYDANQEEMYHYIYDPVTGKLKIFHRHKDGTTVQVYEGPPIQDPGKMPPPDPPSGGSASTPVNGSSSGMASQPMSQAL